MVLSLIVGWAWDESSPNYKTTHTPTPIKAALWYHLLCSKQMATVSSIVDLISLKHAQSPTLKTPKCIANKFLTHSQSPPLKTPKFIADKLVKFPLNTHKPYLSCSQAAITYGTAGALSETSNVVLDTKKKTNPIVVIDNYDSFTYNLCQVWFSKNPTFFSPLSLYVCARALDYMCVFTGLLLYVSLYV